MVPAVIGLLVPIFRVLVVLLVIAGVGYLIYRILT